MRSALSAVVLPRHGISVGSHPIVRRYMNGVFNLRPPRPRYRATWDVTVVLNYLRSLGPNESLTLKNLTMKLVTLISLISGQRCQTLALINLDNAYPTAQGVKFVITDLIKTRKAGKPPANIILESYPHDDLLCVMGVLKAYLRETRTYRKKKRYLFLSYVRPHRVAGSQTISRWIKTTLKMAGVDTDIFKAHSTRAAACSAALSHGTPLEVIVKSAGWTKSTTFARYYNKPIVQHDSFAKSVLMSTK